MLVWVLGMLLKWTAAFLLIFLVYNGYKYIWLPYQARKYFSQFSNVYVSNERKLLLGDAAKYREDVAKGRVTNYHHIEYALQLKDIDLRLSIMGSVIIINLFSPEALSEFQQKCPKYFDRRGIPNASFGKLFPKAFINNKSSVNWKERREKFLGELGINFASRYIPKMIDYAGVQVQSWSDGESRNLLKEMADVTFAIISTMLFGKDVSGDIGQLKYVSPKDYTEQHLNFNEFYTRTCRDLMGNRFTLKNLFLPFLSRYDIGSPYNTTRQNMITLWNALQEYLSHSQDENSVYYRLIKAGQFSKEEVFQDLLSLLFAGHETSSHAIGSVMYFLYKYPKVKEKLLKELAGLNGKSHEEIRTILTKDRIEEFDYLHMVVKESLRIDNPAQDSMPYEVVADTEIRGVPLKVGSIINANLQPQHYNPQVWNEPLKFIPERFDPENEYFTMPGTKKPRGPLSHIPFSFGLRSCPGQTLANLEIKVILAYLLSRVEFQFDQKLLDSDYALFGMISNLQLNFTSKIK